MNYHIYFFADSPRITNPGIKCEGIDNDKCYNKMDYYEYNKYIHLEVHFSGDGPFNISWFFNFTHLLNNTINSPYQNNVSINYCSVCL